MELENGLGALGKFTSWNSVSKVAKDFGFKKTPGQDLMEYHSGDYLIWATHLMGKQAIKLRVHFPREKNRNYPLKETLTIESPEQFNSVVSGFIGGQAPSAPIVIDTPSFDTQAKKVPDSKWREWESAIKADGIDYAKKANKHMESHQDYIMADSKLYNSIFDQMTMYGQKYPGTYPEEIRDRLAAVWFPAYNSVRDKTPKPIPPVVAAGKPVVIESGYSKKEQLARAYEFGKKAFHNKIPYPWEDKDHQNWFEDGWTHDVADIYDLEWLKGYQSQINKQTPIPDHTPEFLDVVAEEFDIPTPTPAPEIDSYSMADMLEKANRFGHRAYKDKIYEPDDDSFFMKEVINVVNREDMNELTDEWHKGRQAEANANLPQHMPEEDISLLTPYDEPIISAPAATAPPVDADAAFNAQFEQLLKVLGDK